jgi:hypothetical protein
MPRKPATPPEPCWQVSLMRGRRAAPGELRARGQGWRQRSGHGAIQLAARGNGAGCWCGGRIRTGQRHTLVTGCPHSALGSPRRRPFLSARRKRRYGALGEGRPVRRRGTVDRSTYPLSSRLMMQQHASGEAFARCDGRQRPGEMPVRTSGAGSASGRRTSRCRAMAAALIISASPLPPPRHSSFSAKMRSPAALLASLSSRASTCFSSAPGCRPWLASARAEP